MQTKRRHQQIIWQLRLNLRKEEKMQKQKKHSLLLRRRLLTVESLLLTREQDLKQVKGPRYLSPILVL